MLKPWDLAVQASGLSHNEVHLLPVPGAAVSGYNQAANYPAGRTLIDDPEDLLHGDMLAEANHPDNINKHRVAIYEDVDRDNPVAVAILAGKLRHELRHAEQRVACGEGLQELVDLAEDIIRWKAGGLPSSAVLYQLKPTELDANAASAMLLNALFPTQVQAVLESQDVALARSNTPPGDLLDLPAKTVAFMFLFREVAEEPERSASLTFTGRLGLINRRYAAMWQTLCSSSV